MLIQWNGSKWTGNDIPDFNTAAPGSNTGPFIMQPEGLGRLFALDKLAEGPFPEHYEPMETPLGTNPLHPNVISSPVVRLYEDDALRLGKRSVPLRRHHLSSDRAFPHGPSMRGLTPSPSRNSLWKSAKVWRRRKALPTAIG